MEFQDLQLSEPLLRAVGQQGYTVPTPIQQQAIPPVLAGRDLQGCAQTGTGKTAAFTLPILQLLAAEPAPKGRRPIRALVITPTRELAIQIDECCRDYARYTSIRHCVIFGGVNQRPQVDALQRGVDLLIATPGRLLDLIGQGYVTLDTIRFFVLDEADRMLDMGFIHDIRRILPLLPERRQTLFFSATMPESIAALAAKILRDPVLVTVTPPASVVETISQQVYFAEKGAKNQLLIDLLAASDAEQVLVFTRTKHGADRLSRVLTKAGIRSSAIHGNKSQNARVKAMNDFKSGECRVLIATDIAARGIDIKELPLVINYELPEVPETYVHRIGRTGRAGIEGTAWSFCTEEEYPYLKQIEKTIGLEIPTAGPVPPFAAQKAAPARKTAKTAQAPARSKAVAAPDTAREADGSAEQTSAPKASESRSSLSRRRRGTRPAPGTPIPTAKSADSAAGQVPAASSRRQGAKSGANRSADNAAKNRSAAKGSGQTAKNGPGAGQASRSGAGKSGANDAGQSSRSGAGKSDANKSGTGKSAGKPAANTPQSGAAGASSRRRRRPSGSKGKSPAAAAAKPAPAPPAEAPRKSWWKMW